MDFPELFFTFPNDRRERNLFQKAFTSQLLRMRSSTLVVWQNPRNRYAKMIKAGRQPAEVKREMEKVGYKLGEYLSPELQNCLLIAALTSGNFPEYFQYFLYQGIDVNVGPPLFSPVLHLAIEIGDYEAVDLLLSRNADVNIGVEVCDGMEYHKNALSVALHMDDVKMMKIVLDRIDLTKLSVKGRTALHMACEYNASRCIAYLLSEISCPYFYLDEIMFILGIQQEADAIYSTTYSKSQLGECLHGMLTSNYFVHCLKELLVIVELMLHEGLDINYRKNSLTPIEALIRHHTMDDSKILDMVNFLLSHGAFVHMSTVRGTIRETISDCYREHVELGTVEGLLFDPITTLGMVFWYPANAQRIIYNTAICDRNRISTRPSKPYEILMNGTNFPVGPACLEVRELLRLIVVNFGNKYHKNVCEFAVCDNKCGCYRYAAQLFLSNQHHETYQLIAHGLNQKSRGPHLYVPPIRSLKELCRVRILGRLRIPKYASVELLQLPLPLQRYITFQEGPSILTPEWIQEKFDIVSRRASDISTRVTIAKMETIIREAQAMRNILP